MRIEWDLKTAGLFDEDGLPYQDQRSFWRMRQNPGIITQTDDCAFIDFFRPSQLKCG